MVNKIFFYITLSISIILFIIFIIQIIKIRNLNKLNAKLAASANPPSQFDTLVAQGMEIINDFLRNNALKFINSKLIELNENTEIPITQLLNDLSSDDKMKDFVTGFVVYVDALMSKDLKLLFNRYYNVIDNETGLVNHNFIQYISEWLILYIRKIQADLSSQKAGSDDYSMHTNVIQNSNMFMNIELELYDKFNIIDKINSEKQ